MKKRIKYLDIAKALGIICVCVGHSGPPNYIVTFITLFHMPLFYFISGVLYKDEYSYHPLIRLKKSFKAYYLPFLIFDLAYLLFHNIFVVLHFVNEENGEGWYNIREYGIHFLNVLIKGHREYFSGALWFLVAIFLITVGFSFGNYILHKLNLDKYRIRILVGMSTLCFVISKIEQIHKPMIVRRCMTGIFFFTLGYLFHRYNLNRVLLKHKKYFVSIGLLSLFTITFLNEKGFFKDVFNNAIAAFIGGVFGISLVIILSQSKMLIKSKSLNFIGNASLCIMATHFLAFKLVSYIIVILYKLPIERMADYPVIPIGAGWWLIYTIVGTFIPTLGYYLYKKIKIQKGCR